ncbi:hypothetical protein FVE85_2578 [Porphyridium purpureum]|uniref:Myb-like domain-containing protein n=1 Tax=Porphyridium purpureum TaxID=35688 RepID=A0A5J4YLP4_PORPP|nr:hypothetical protein FVE85_2578 [Porphyridium purpureum]|eukprot:POR1941..scf291_13
MPELAAHTTTPGDDASAVRDAERKRAAEREAKKARHKRRKKELGEEEYRRLKSEKQKRKQARKERQTRQAGGKAREADVAALETTHDAYAAQTAPPQVKSGVNMEPGVARESRALTMDGESGAKPGAKVVTAVAADAQVRPREGPQEQPRIESETESHTDPQLLATHQSKPRTKQKTAIRTANMLVYRNPLPVDEVSFFFEHDADFTTMCSKAQDIATMSEKRTYKWHEEHKHEFLSGPFTSSERRQLWMAMAATARAHSMQCSAPEHLQIIAQSRPRLYPAGFWLRVADLMPQRSVQSVLAQAGNLLSKVGEKRGPWSEEEDAQLYFMLGATPDEKNDKFKWQKIGDELGRSRSACRERYRALEARKEHERKDIANGSLGPSEVQLVMNRVARLGFLHELAQRPLIPWQEVARGVPHRTARQCQAAWVIEVEQRGRNHKSFSQISGTDLGLIRKLKALPSNCVRLSQIPWDQLVPGLDPSRARARFRTLSRFYIPEIKTCPRAEREEKFPWRERVRVIEANIAQVVERTDRRKVRRYKVNVPPSMQSLLEVDSGCTGDAGQSVTPAESK